MAWLKCLKRLPIEDKTVPVNRTNFPNSGVGYSSMHSVSTSENSIYGHTAGGNGSAYVQTGSFNCAGYSKIEINWSSNNWGNSVPGSKIYVNNTQVATCTLQGSGTTTYLLNGADTINNVKMECTFNSGNDAWLTLTLSSIRFIV